MRNLIIRYYTNQPVSNQEVYEVIEKYMVAIGKQNTAMLHELFTGISLMYGEMIKHAFRVSIEYHEKQLGIVRLYDKQNKLIDIW